MYAEKGLVEPAVVDVLRVSRSTAWGTQDELVSSVHNS